MGRSGPGARSAEVRQRLTRKAGRALIWPKGYTDIDGRVVIVREIVRYNIVSPSAPDIEWELATVQAMARGQQRRYPTHYNIRTSGSSTAPIVNKSIELVPGQTWDVWRGRQWWSSGQQMPEPDSEAALMHKDATDEEEQDMGDPTD